MGLFLIIIILNSGMVLMVIGSSFI